MLVLARMSERLITVGPDQVMPEAVRLMKENGVGRLPVIKGDSLVGIVSSSDIKEASASDATLLEVHELNYLLQKVKVKDIMTPRVVTVDRYDTVEEAAQKMLEHKVGGLPVTDGSGRVMGMITESDVFRALVSVSGINRGGMQFAIDLPDRPGTIRRVADIIRSYGGRIVSILTSYDDVAEGWRTLYIRAVNLPNDLYEQICLNLFEVGRFLFMHGRENGVRRLLVGDGRRVIALGEVDKSSGLEGRFGKSAETSGRHRLAV